MLTMLADDNRQYAESIVAVIEDYLKRVSGACLLLLLLHHWEAH